MRRLLYVLIYILCVVLAGCGRASSVSAETISESLEIVVSESSIGMESDLSEKTVEEVTDEELYEEPLLKPEMKESYSDWQEAYADFVEFQAWQDVEETSEYQGKSFDKEDIDWTKDHNSYYLIYVDNDDIPELFISSNSTAGGCIVATFYDGKCNWDYLADETSRYIPYEGYLYTDDGKAYISIKKLEKGQFDTVFFGEYHRFSPDGNDGHEECEYWLLGGENEVVSEENSVTEKVFKTAIKQLLNIDEAIWPDREYKYAEISSALSKGEGQMLIDEWRKAYFDYIEENYSYHFNYTDELMKDHLSYTFIYLDDDDIPEIFITTNSGAGGEMVLTYYGGKVSCLELYRLESQYIERSGLIYTDTGHMGEYPVTITKLENGVFTEIGNGVYRLVDDKVVKEEYEYEYEWEGKKVSEKTFNSKIAKIYNKKESKYPDEYDGYVEFGVMLKTGHYSSYGHRYELIVDDVTWEEAFQAAKDAGGYLAIVTGSREYKKLAEQIKNNNLTKYYFHVAYNTNWDAPDGWVYPDGSIVDGGYQDYIEDPDYSHEWADWKYKDGVYGLLKYCPTDSNVYLYYAPANIFGYINDDGSYVTDRFNGQIGYIIEYDN